MRAWLGYHRATEAHTPDLLAWRRRERLPRDPDDAHVQGYALA
jgi:hypothetical protein